MMTLCEKLRELGYICDNMYFIYHKSYYDIDAMVAIYLDSTEKEMQTYGVVVDESCLYRQEQIDQMQVAFNRLASDIKEIKKWQKQIAKYSK